MKLHGSIIVTYRCNARCNMCDTWRIRTKPADEITVDCINKLPQLFFANVTGGEPFIRTDLSEIVGALRRKARRIVISTNGYFSERIIELCRMYPDVGVRISIEGLRCANDRIRGIPNGFDRIQQTLNALQNMGMHDIGFAMTVQDQNYHDLVALYKMAKEYGYEFATAAVHNSHYFHKWDNVISKKTEATTEIKKLIAEFLKSKRIKEWFRAYFNYGLINYIEGRERLLPCEMGNNGFFLDPSGNILACNGMEQPLPLGNLKHQSWQEIWNGQRAQGVRAAVRNCKRNCWMIGSAAPAIIHHPIRPILWILKNRFIKKRQSQSDENSCPGDTGLSRYPGRC